MTERTFGPLCLTSCLWEDGFMPELKHLSLSFCACECWKQKVIPGKNKLYVEKALIPVRCSKPFRSIGEFINYLFRVDFKVFPVVKLHIPELLHKAYTAQIADKTPSKVFNFLFL